ncbi:MAG TPA: histidine phosphatase family protein [Flavisolibacter sp.]|jgi:hypothetical protein|nr:histidine phosphatase family protein [Flavisolibacter sp.]
MNFQHLKASSIIILLFCSFYASYAQPQKIVIIRHGEKPDKGDNLSCQGLNRSLQLPSVLNKKIGVPDAIFVPALNVGKKTSAARMYQTIIPFAVKYNLSINTKYDVKDEAGVANAIKKENGTVLLVWEHKAIIKIIRALGITDQNINWDDNDFDSMWIITYVNGKPVLHKETENIRPSAACQ